MDGSNAKAISPLCSPGGRSDLRRTQVTLRRWAACGGLKGHIKTIGGQLRNLVPCSTMPLGRHPLVSSASRSLTCNGRSITWLVSRLQVVTDYLRTLPTQGTFHSSGPV
jgi:hypothetical protein